MKHWFLPEVPDLLGMLRKQASVTSAGIDLFRAWSHGDSTQERAIRDREHDADDAKHTVQVALRSAFSTPLDPEDLYELSERMDTVMNAAKNIVREADVMAMSPDEHMGAMADHIANGQQHLARAFDAIAVDNDAATSESDAAVQATRELERRYRRAMSELLTESDLREVMGRRELYRRYSRAGESIEAVAERVWYAVVKSP